MPGTARRRSTHRSFPSEAATWSGVEKDEEEDEEDDKDDADDEGGALPHWTLDRTLGLTPLRLSTSSRHSRSADSSFVAPMAKKRRRRPWCGEWRGRWMGGGGCWMGGGQAKACGDVKG